MATEPTTEEMETRIVKLLDARAFDKAADLLTTAITSRPTDEWAFRLRGLARLELNEIAGALSDLSRAVELAPNDPKGWARLAEVRVAKGDLKGAAANIGRALELDPLYPRAWVTRGKIRSQQGDHVGGIVDLSRALELEHDSAWMWTARARIRSEVGDFQGALADATQATALDPSYAYGWACQADLAVKTEDIELAIAAASRLIALEPDNRWAYGTRGVALGERGDVVGAIADFSRAIELDPANGWSWAARGMARTQEGDLEGALADFTRAAELHPEDDMAWIHRGRTLLDLGDAEGAIGDFTRAIELGGGSAYTYAARAKARLQQSEFHNLGADLSVVAPQDTLMALAVDSSQIANAFSDLQQAFRLDPEVTASVLYGYEADAGLRRDHLQSILDGTRWMVDQRPGDLEELLMAVSRSIQSTAGTERLVELVSLEPALQIRVSNGVHGADIAHAALMDFVILTIDELAQQGASEEAVIAELRERTVAARAQFHGGVDFELEVGELKARLAGSRPDTPPRPAT